MRFGIDLGGTKIEGVVIDASGRELARRRRDTPPGSYEEVLSAIASLVEELEGAVAAGGVVRAARVGIATPGFLVPSEGVIRNSNLAPLNGRRLDVDLCASLGRQIRIANDANCFVLSEFVDGAAAIGTGGRPPPPTSTSLGGVEISVDAAPEPDVVFGATLGTGVGGGFVVGGRVRAGRNGSAGEWSHLTLPFLTAADGLGAGCYCGRPACIESFLSGKSIEWDHARAAGRTLSARDIAHQADRGVPDALATMDRYADRLARALSMVVNLTDPRVIVLGGGISNNLRLFDVTPERLRAYTVSPSVATSIVRAKHGDASGVRGAAWLWPGPGSGEEEPTHP